MKNTYPVFVGPYEFTCTQFYDTDASMNGVDITNAENGNYIGQVMDIAIPEMDDPDYDEQCCKFDTIIEDFILSN